MTENNTENNTVNTIGKLDDILKQMDRANESFVYGIWVPSLNKEVMFRELNTSQQKRLIKSIIDSPVFNTEFIFALRQIIKENCVDNINTDDFTVLDKLFIIVKMRAVSIGNTYEITIDEKIKRGLGLEEFLEKAKKQLKIPEPQKLTDDKGIFSVDCNIPTIGTEYSLEMEFRSNTTDIDIDSIDKLKKVIGESFINEIVKYITCLSIKQDDKITQVIFDNNVTFKTRITLIEKLPTKLLEKIVNYINTIRKELDKISVYKFEYEKDGVKEIKEERLTIDGSFFTIS